MEENNTTILLKKIVKRSGLDQDEFAESIGLKKAAFNNYIKGRRDLPKTVITALMEVYNVNPAAFFDNNAELFINTPPIVSVVAGSDNNFGTKAINLYGSVAAGALAIVDGVTESNVEQINLSPMMLGMYANERELFAMKVSGDSMNKIICDGEIVIAKQQEHYKDGDIVVFSHNNEYSLKRYAPNELEGFVLFKAESYDKNFKDIPVPKNCDGELKILGKIIYCGKIF